MKQLVEHVGLIREPPVIQETFCSCFWRFGFGTTQMGVPLVGAGLAVL